MIRVEHCLVAGLILLGGVGGAAAEKRICAGADTAVRVEVGKMVDIYMEDGISDLVRWGDPATVKVEHAAGHLFLTPLTAAPAGITILDSNGRSHRVRYVFGEGVDDKVTIADCRVPAGPAAGTDPVMAAMRALMQERQPEGVVRHNGGQVVFEDAQLRLVLLWSDEWPMVAGYVLAAENVTDAPVILPLQRITYPGLLAVAAEEDTLGPRMKGRIYMVVRR